MALEGKESFPNLKICIDNDESDAENDNISLTEDSQIDIDDTESDKRILIPANAETSPPSSPFQQHAVDKKDDVQFNVYLNKLDPPQTEKPTIRPTRVYENKSGDFVTGIDFRVESSVERMQERAKRFGIDFIPEPAVDLETLYDSLGLKPDDVKLKDERGMRLDAIHIRGVTEMNTKDVFKYFQEFAPGGCEWIDDESCNVVWLDKMTAARAMLKLSRSYNDVMAEYGLKLTKPAPRRPSQDKPSKEGAGDAGGDKAGEEREEEKMEEEEEDLDLTEDISQPAQDKQPDKMEDEGIEEGEISDSDSDMGEDDARRQEFNKIAWPPGRWRLGVPFQHKARNIFLRFANKADVKLPGAEKRSKFYQKYGNPNYGGVKGLLSKSMKRRMRQHETGNDLETFGVPAVSSSIGNRNQISYEDDLFSSSVVPAEVEEMDIYSTAEKHGTDKRRAKLKDKPAGDESEEGEMESASEDDADFPIIERVDPTHGEQEGSGSDVDEAELNRLLGVRNKRPSMKMYADEVEEKQQANRTRQMVGALSIVADAKKKVKKVNDARQLIVGADLRDALKEKKMNKQKDIDIHRDPSPDDWKIARKIVNDRLSPVSWSRSRSRSQSPEVEGDFENENVRKFKIAPMHMTIENDIENESPSEEEEEEEEEEEGEIEKIVRREFSPASESEQEDARRIISKKSRALTPDGLKSKMDEVHRQKDVRSRLSDRAKEDLSKRLSRRSPNNVRSRLSKRVSPERRSPVRIDERRFNRVRRSRSLDNFRSGRMRKSPSPRSRRREFDRTRSPIRSPIKRRFRDERSPVQRRLNVARSRSRSPLRRRPMRSRSRSPLMRRRSPVQRPPLNRTRKGRDARSRLGRKSRSPTDTEQSDSEEEQAPAPKAKQAAMEEEEDSSSSSSSSSSSDSSSSSSSSDSSSSSSESSSSESSSSSSSSDSDASERSAIRNKKVQRKIVPPPSRSDTGVSKRSGKNQRPRSRDKEMARQKNRGLDSGRPRDSRRDLRSAGDYRREGRQAGGRRERERS
ncbi:nuclear cap-binding protein subunit 3-like [Mya arenaria]|uniref:nuclear cap-binding protein subunit 3-like n=1 Tax=Mya arenaria TaxID=6604 RepID=UPI0022E62722|nr:nuclear cap-binding protein subunit 3-like [Mya arenaria]